jgi:hypothetical protein
MTIPRIKINNEDIENSDLSEEKKQQLRDLAAAWAESTKTSPFAKLCSDVGDILYTLYQREEERGDGCGKQFLQWAKDAMYGRMVADHLKHFDSCYAKLEAKGHIGQENRFVYGDLDVGLWIEKSERRGRKVIVSESYCTCADESITIFVKDDKAADWIDFRVTLACPDHFAEEKREEWKKVHGWEPKSWDYPNLGNHRDADWEYGYKDFRDKFHVLNWTNSYDERGKVDGAYATENLILHTLWELRMHDQMADEENMI